MKYEGIYWAYKDVGCFTGNEMDLKLHNFSFSNKLQIYNRSDTPKIMRDFKVVFEKDKKVVYSLVPDNEATRRFAAHTYRVDEMEVSNIMPREIQVLDHSGYIREEELDLIEGSTKVELLYYDEKDKKRRCCYIKGK